MPSRVHSAKYFKNKKFSLPSGRFETLGKELKKNLNLCRVPDQGHSAKKLKTKKTNLCRVPNCRRSAKKAVTGRRFHGQPMPSVEILPRVWHSAKKSFAECPIFYTLAKALFPVVYSLIYNNKEVIY